MSRQSTVQVGLSDVTGINTNSIILTIGTNGEMVLATISVADTLGN